MKSVPGSTLRSRFSLITESLVLPGVIFALIGENNAPFCNQIKMLNFVSKKDMNLIQQLFEIAHKMALCCGNAHRIRSRKMRRQRSDEHTTSLSDFDNLCVKLRDSLPICCLY